VKDRIKELAWSAAENVGKGELPDSHTIQVAITTAVNEALELAAKECEKTDPSEWVNPSSAYAEAIRKLKV